MSGGAQLMRASFYLHSKCMHRESRVDCHQTRRHIYSRAYHKSYSFAIKSGKSPAEARLEARLAAQSAVPLDLD